MDNQDIICYEKCKVKVAYNQEAFSSNSKQAPQMLAFVGICLFWVVSIFLPMV
jgi:hypothetical protein